MAIEDEEIYDFLEHFGVQGMRWGVRKGPREISRRTNKDAAKDAKEFSRAKAFFGEGAGTRRKLIKQTVEAKSKRDPNYAKAFEQHLTTQDQSKHVSKAKSERKRKDVAKTTKKTAGGLARSATGQMATSAAIGTLALGGIAFMASPRGQQIMRKQMGKLNNAKDMIKRRNGARHIKKMFNL